MADDDAAQTEHTIFVLPLPPSLTLPPSTFPSLRAAVAHTTHSILVLVLSPLFDVSSQPQISHTQTWPQIQNVLAPLYIEASHEAMLHDRVLLDVDVLLRGVRDGVVLDWDLFSEGEGTWGRVWVPEECEFL